MDEIFPDALTPLKAADPEMWQLIEKEKQRQWCVCCHAHAARTRLARCATPARTMLRDAHAMRRRTAPGVASRANPLLAGPAGPRVAGVDARRNA